jgi:hypothetical protein
VHFERELRARKVIALAAEAIAQEHFEARERHPLLRRHVFADRHAIPGAAEAAYRRGDLIQKRRLLMQAWADFCAKPAAIRGARS